MTDPYYAEGPVTLYEGDCIEVMRGLPDESVDAVVTDPPYGLEFMGREWDGDEGFRRSLQAAGRPVVLGQISDGDRSQGPLPTGGTHSRGYADHDSNAFQAWCEVWAREALRVLKPGGHMLAFGGSRTWHRLTVAVEDAGFEIRDSIAWLYGSGFPKSLDVSKAIDKALGVEGTFGAPKSVAHAALLEKGSARRGEKHPGWDRPWMDDPEAIDRAQRKYEAGSDAAREWEGWGTALKPAFEPVVVARKPLVGTVAAYVLAYGVGALNIDATRISAPPGDIAIVKGTKRTAGIMGLSTPRDEPSVPHESGRWPANVVLDESQAAALDQQSGTLTSGTRRAGTYRGIGYGGSEATGYPDVIGDSGGASRFFYVAKADSNERPRDGEVAHPTVKPLDLMQWLVRLVTPPAGVVLEPFAGSGTTVEACIREGFSCIAIEREPAYLPLIMQRINKPHEQSLF